MTEVQRARWKVVEDGNLFLIWRRLLSLPRGLCDVNITVTGRGQTLGGDEVCFL